MNPSADVQQSDFAALSGWPKELSFLSFVLSTSSFFPPIFLDSGCTARKNAEDPGFPLIEVSTPNRCRRKNGTKVPLVAPGNIAGISLFFFFSFNPLSSPFFSLSPCRKLAATVVKQESWMDSDMNSIWLVGKNRVIFVLLWRLNLLCFCLSQEPSFFYRIFPKGI